MSTVTPRSPYILVKAVGETRTSGGLFVPPGDDRKAPVRAQVLATSEGYEGEALSEGSQVLVIPATGYSVSHNGEPAILVKATDILAVVQ